MPRINSIGAYDKGGSNEIGAYGFRSVTSTRVGSPVSNDIGAYDTAGNDIGAWQDDQTVAPPGGGGGSNRTGPGLAFGLMGKMGAS